MRELFMFMCLLVFLACTGKSKQETHDKQETKPAFEMVAVPALITQPQERADYLMEHYWDKFDFTDTTYIHYPEITEQAFSDFINLFHHATARNVAPSITRMLEKAQQEPVMYSYFTGLYEKYLYDPLSPMRNEEWFIPVLNHMINTPLLSETEKIRPQHLLKIALKNRVGEKANDFAYTLENGRTGTLYGIDSPYLLLYFSNPGCDACKILTHQLSSSPIIGRLQDTKQLKILSVYTDEEVEEWKRNLPQFPKQWINAYDPNLLLKSEETYDLKAIPCLYLLDSNKIVLLKDVTFEQAEAYLYNHSSL